MRTLSRESPWLTEKLREFRGAAEAPPIRVEKATTAWGRIVPVRSGLSHCVAAALIEISAF